MRFDMGQTTLSSLSKGTQQSQDDLGALVVRLVSCVEPLEGRFNGAGRAAFDRFKAGADQVAIDLNSALSSILLGQSEMNLAFQAADQEAQENAEGAQSSANFDGARFAARN